MADRIGGLQTWRELCEKAEAERDSLRRQVAAVSKQAEEVRAELAEVKAERVREQARAEKAEAEQRQLFRALPYGWHKQYERAEKAEAALADARAACCCETSPPEFGGPIPERDCPLHGEPAYQRGMVEGARQVLAAAEPLIEEIRAGGVFQRRAWPTEVCDDILATVREAVAEIENRKAAK